MLIIKKFILESILHLCMEAHPYEVGGFLINNPVDDFVLLPGKYEKDSILFFIESLPIYPKKVGTFHSHPSGSPIPSRADKQMFPKLGPYHLIIAFPYTFESVKAYDAKGREIGWKLDDDNPH